MYILSIRIGSLLLLWIMTTQSDAKDTEVQEYCLWQSFNATCPDGAVIVMTNANYGRMRSNHCVNNEQNYMGCLKDMLFYMDSLCSGKRNCVVPTTSFINEGFHPCPMHVVSYLEASYDCVPVRQQKCISSDTILFRDPFGIFQYGKSTHACHWRIEAKPGQRVNITMFDFDVWTRQGSDQPATFCDSYAVVSEGSSLQQTICGSDERTRNVYVSRSNIVEIFMTRRQTTETPNIVMEYNVFGCPDIPQHPGSHVTIEDNVAVVTCEEDGSVQTLTCVDDVWDGEVLPCVQDGNDLLGVILGEASNSSFGVYAAILTCGIILGLLTGPCCVLVVLVCLKRNGQPLPCGLSSSKRSTTQPTLPKKSHFDYQYSTAINPHAANNTIRRNEHVFIDPRTGLMYNTNSIKRSDVSGIRDIHNDCYQHTSVASATHIYDCPNYDVQSVQEDDDYVQETHTDSTNTMDNNTVDKSLYKSLNGMVNG